ncbi:hypothetical protein C8A00DRAFT_44343 [Chaetomidium leptoderma]|uniref:Uncharacterized protein n=1 Tax=Chaetomidium leptoderma TaxID=669021 RepID=A0AAN6ZW84_9PEZI|nr:hypothetical protein C8A00DRAFT_44343 [Chaetomidium leptoderma]
MVMHPFLMAASAAVLVSAQAQAPSAGCTGKSFSIPSWLIQDVKRSNGAVAFDFANRATNYTASLSCDTVKTGLNACTIQGTPSSDDALEAAVEIKDGSTGFFLTQSWTCDDRGKVLTFTATGNSSAAAGYTSPLLVRGSLTAPVAITPVYAEGPTGHDSAGCTARSEEASWVLSAIHYTDEPASGEGTVPFVNFNVLVTNPANGYQASCMPGGSFGDKPDLSRLVCAGEEFQSSKVGQYPIATEASFDPATTTFSLNQTWFCDDTDAAKPLEITASATLALPLTCTTELSPQNQTNTYCSSPTDITLAAKLGRVTTLRPYVLEDPTPASPRGDGCTLTSIFAPRWQFSAFQVNGGQVTFEVILNAPDRGFQYPIPIYQGEKTEGGGWYKCEVGADGGNGLPLWPYQCEFRYDADTKGLVLRADWECRDLDGVHPVNFSGLTTTVVNSTLSCETVDGESRCVTDDPGYTWVADIADVTWGKA